MLAIINTVNKFEHYITNQKMFVHIGHFSIMYLMNKTISNGGVTRLLLLLHKFNNINVNLERKIKF